MNAIWMQSLRGFLHGIKWTMFQGHFDYFKKPPLGGRPNTKTGDHGTFSNVHNRWFILIYHVWRPTWLQKYINNIWLRAWYHMASHYTWGSVITLHDFEGVLGRPLDTFFGLSQFHGHGSWLVCGVALSAITMRGKYPVQPYLSSIQHSNKIK